MIIYHKESPIKLLRSLLRELAFDVYIISDKTKKITYITSSDIDSYFVEKICGKDATITKIKRIYLWELKKFADQQDAVLIDMYRPFSRLLNNGFLVPPLVRQVLDIDVPADIRLRGSDVHKLKKYSVEISNDLEDLKFFYEKMHIPHIKIRYNSAAYIENFNNIKKIFKKGELLFAKLNGERVAGALCEIDSNYYFLRKNGILDEKFIKEGALLTTYYFPIIRAKEINAKIVDFGQSRSFLSDGVLRHKSHWGTRICEDKNIKRIVYLRNIFEPYIYIEDKKLKAIVFSGQDKLINEYSRSGLEFNIVNKKIAMENK